MFSFIAGLVPLLLALEAAAQVTLTGTNQVSSNTATALPTATYIIYDSTSSVLSTLKPTNASTSGLSTSIAASNGSSGTTATSTTSASVTYLTGRLQWSSTSINGTALHNATSTSSSVQPINTQPCNGHPEFCSRKFSNITMVAAHNSPFVRPNNAASNQVLDVTTQLSDGIRMRESSSFSLRWPPANHFLKSNQNRTLLMTRYTSATRHATSSMLAH